MRVGIVGSRTGASSGALERVPALRGGFVQSKDRFKGSAVSAALEFASFVILGVGDAREQEANLRDGSFMASKRATDVAASRCAATSSLVSVEGLRPEISSVVAV